jgi:hypothetical protein
MRIGKRFLAEAVALAAFSLLVMLTALSPNWIELAFGVDPDSRSGWIEWALVAAPILGGAAGATLVYYKWSKARIATWGD